MDQLIPRKPQDIDRWSDQAERDPVTDPAAGPQDRWVNESYRGNLDEPGADAGEGGTEALNRALEDDGDITGSPTDPTIHGQAR
jgi:hypothetical protein